jgi:hypothetical protein
MSDLAHSALSPERLDVQSPGNFHRAERRRLEMMLIGQPFGNQVGVSDINRKCTGQIEGAGTASSHYFKGWSCC